MKHTTVALLALTAALAACDKPKPPPAPAAPPAPISAAPSASGPILSGGLARRPEFPGFYLDHIGAAIDPLNRKPAVTPGAQPIVLNGFGFDPTTKLPARGVDVVIDGKAYPTTYGAPRPDVARFTKVEGLTPVGFTTTLPAGALDSGEHILVVRVIASDGSGYFESPQFKFEVN